MSGHTPGPWEVKQIDYSKGLDVSFEVIATDANHMVAQTIMREKGDGWRDKIIEKDRVNARLIAAAPDMANAIDLIIAWDDGDDVLTLTDAMVACRKAKAKAEGKL